ncbi:MAG: bifunctional phosphoglucose/phosphomannose isomerase [Armatimonadota bacterium]|nr:bifunctional phosphoglucose/phosphomannose isomerase [Armatimonadota bacterium]MDR5696132.1 bifunctional phosphoglucose/phosphomannose isomerase [Armatimonadota bacterium]
MPHLLDDADRRRALDPQDMLGLALRLGETLREGWALGLEADVGGAPDAVDHVLVMGLGGSGIGGDLLRSVLFDSAPFPVVVVKDYALPAWVGPRTLAFACSYSGNTEETLAAYAAARRAKARCVAITSGGELAHRAHADGVPVISIPSGWPPRAALGYLFAPLLAVLERWEVVRGHAAGLEEAALLLAALGAAWGPERPQSDNPAKQLARSLLGRVPVVYAASRFTEAAALRWKCQLNENGKVYAVWNTFPELNHNETVGWGLSGQPDGLFEVVVLRDASDPPRLAQRVEITREIALGGAAGFHEVHSEGADPLARLMSLILFGDLVSVYLAYSNEVDPYPVPVIDELKRRLGEAGTPP